MSSTVSKKVRTVLGDITSDELGFTYSHEHLFAVPPSTQKDRDLELSDYDKSLEELISFKSAGGQTLVEASTIDYGRNALAYKNMAIASGVNVVCTTGFNKQIYYPSWVSEKSIEEIADIMIRDIEVGIDGTDVKAGFLKTGSYYNLIHPLEEKVTHAVALAYKKTGAPIWVHTEVGTMGLEMVELLEKDGVPLSDVAIGHLDRNCDPFYLLSIAKKGVYVQFDGPGKVKYYPDSTRIEMLKILRDAGHLDQILISGDMGRASYLKAYGGGPGFEFIIKKFIPRMLAEGFSEHEIKTIFYDNPKRWLARF
jgi:phosphotriesterase-related protein